MTNQTRPLTIEELEQVAGGFEAVEHSQMTTMEAMSKQYSNILQAVISVIRGI